MNEYCLPLVSAFYASPSQQRLTHIYPFCSSNKHTRTHNRQLMTSNLLREKAFFFFFLSARELQFCFWGGGLTFFSIAEFLHHKKSTQHKYCEKRQWQGERLNISDMAKSFNTQELFQVFLVEVCGKRNIKY